MKFYHFCLLSFASSVLSLTVLHPNGVNNMCLDVQGGVVANGTPVQIATCNGTPAQQWILNLGATTVRLANTNFCLDSTFEIPPDAMPMKIWQCVDGAPAQQWFYVVKTASSRLILANRGICLDLRGGSLNYGNPVQTWKCVDGETNQIWTN